MKRKKQKGFSAGKGLWFMALVLLGFLSTLAYQSLFQPAQNNPIRYANGGMHRPGRKAVVIAGGDMVRGKISFNYVEYLSQKPELQDYQFINAGINSDLSSNLLKRLGTIVSCRPASIIIQIGTDDVLGAMYPKFATYYQYVKRASVRPNPEFFRRNMTLIVEKLKENTGAKIGLVGLPMIGERVQSEVNRQVVIYNKIIEDIALQQKVRFLPVYPAQVRYLSASRRISVPQKDGDYKIIGESLFEHLALKKSLDEIAFRNDFLLHTDGIHLNTPSGLMIAREIEKFLKK